MSDSTDKRSWVRKHKVITVILVFVVLGIIGAVSNGNGNNTPTTSTSSLTSSNSSKSSSNAPNTAETTSTTPKLNQPANDGKFQFTITSFQCGQSQITQSDNQYEVATAQGQFCTMGLTVKNIGNVAQTFDDSSQYIYDSGNKQYNDDSNGTIAANPSSSQFMTLPNVNPGVSISGVVTFDIPKSVQPTYAMLHDSSLSNGVKVSLQ